MLVYGLCRTTAAAWTPRSRLSDCVITSVGPVPTMPNDNPDPLAPGVAVAYPSVGLASRHTNITLVAGSGTDILIPTMGKYRLEYVATIGPTLPGVQNFAAF